MKKYYCKDCKTEIWCGSIRCKHCARIYQYKTKPETNYFFGLKGKLNPSFKHGKSAKNNICIDCGIKIWFESIRCKHCARIYQYQNKPETHPMKGKHHTNGSLKKIRNAMKKLWKNLEYRNKAVTLSRKNMHLNPNKPEKIVKQLLSKISKDYKYVGDGSFIIQGFNPDFMNINGQKKLIEIYGSYWHKRPEAIKRDIRRIKIYRKYGYKTLIIWEHDLKNLNKVINKLLSFTKKGNK